LRFFFFSHLLSVHCSIPMSSSFCICIFAVCFHVWFSYALCHYDPCKYFPDKATTIQYTMSKVGQCYIVYCCII
jgi:hypothetical protein